MANLQDMVNHQVTVSHQWVNQGILPSNMVIHHSNQVMDNLQDMVNLQWDSQSIHHHHNMDNHKAMDNHLHMVNSQDAMVSLNSNIKRNVTAMQVIQWSGKMLFLHLMSNKAWIKWNVINVLKKLLLPTGIIIASHADQTFAKTAEVQG